MKVLAINGSSRKNGNTVIAINAVMEELEKEGIETETKSLFSKSRNVCSRLNILEYGIWANARRCKK